jgi:hypothetical protein
LLRERFLVEAQSVIRISGGRLLVCGSRPPMIDRFPNTISGRSGGAEPVGLRFPGGNQNEQTEGGNGRSNESCDSDRAHRVNLVLD